MTAYDRDELHDPIQYSLSGDGNEYFQLDPLSGKIVVRDKAGLSVGDRFTLQVKVC